MKGDTDALLEALLESNRQTATSMALIAAHIAKPQPGPTEQIAELKRLIYANPLVWTGAWRTCVSGQTASTFDVIVCPNEKYPQGVIVRLENLTIDTDRRRRFFEANISGQPADLQRALIKSRFPSIPENAGDADLLDVADAGRVEGIAREVMQTIRYQTWRELLLPDQQNLIGQPMSAVRHLLTKVGKFEVVDPGRNSPFPLPQE